MPTNDNEKPMRREEKQRSAFDRLREEITILRIEGTLFCYDKHEAKRRTGVVRNVIKDADGTEWPVSIEIHPTYGQPSTLAYKVAQAIFQKLTQLGEPYPTVIGFTQRELARIVGKSWSGRTSQQLYHAMMQLRRTGITCNVQNKKSKTTLKFDFEFVTEALFSCREEAITECVIQVSDVIVGSLNRHHAVWLNNTKLSTLDPIAAVFFKRLFYHFSNTHTSRRGRSTFKFEKVYEDVCSEWVGGLKPEKYKSRIEKQLGRYLDAVQTTDLIARYEIVPRAKAPGFKIVFHAGTGFFDDYEEFYLRSSSKSPIGQLPVRTWLD